MKVVFLWSFLARLFVFFGCRVIGRSQAHGIPWGGDDRHGQVIKATVHHIWDTIWSTLTLWFILICSDLEWWIVYTSSDKLTELWPITIFPVNFVNQLEVGISGPFAIAILVHQRVFKVSSATGNLLMLSLRFSLAHETHECISRPMFTMCQDLDSI